MRRTLDNLAAPARLGLFALLLAVVGAAAAGLGTAMRGPAPTPGAASGGGMAMDGMAPAARGQANGLATTAGGFTLEPLTTRFATGTASARFRIVDAHGVARHDFTREGGVRLHLILARRDLVGYAHVHPVLQRDGSWLARLTFARPGAYRAFADFERGHEKIVLGADLFVAGAMQPAALPAPRATAAADGYSVALAAPKLRADRESTVVFTVTRNGVPLSSFQSYVGMRGHLVALHEGDLSYAHVHPREANAAGEIGFRVALPAGAHRLFLQFKTAGQVHTAPFTVRVAR